MLVAGTSILGMLCERASLQPDDTAFTFIDYEQDWAGFAESLTWSQLYRRTLSVAGALRRCSSTGDRALILPPQGLDYIVACLGALEVVSVFVEFEVAVPRLRPAGW
jgi:fatty acid CoA ligase FadD28